MIRAALVALLVPIMLFAVLRSGLVIASILIAAGAPAAPVRAGSIAAELEEQRTLQLSIQRFWIARDFALLDALAEEWRTKQSRTSSGYWILSLLYNHLDDAVLAQSPQQFPHGDDWQSIDRWIAENPQSPTPVILKALMLVRQAQDCFVPPRTSRVVRKAPENYRIDFLKAARDLLDSHKDFSARDPHWHLALLRVLRFQGASDDDVLIAHAQAIGAHPLYYQTHFETFRHFIVRWYPNLPMIDAVANTVLNRTKALEGNMVYARLYADAQIELNQGHLFVPTRAIWDRLHVGFQEIEDKYPTSWNAHHFAYQACMAEDTATVRRKFSSFTGPIVREAWQSAVIYDQCKEMAAP